MTEPGNTEPSNTEPALATLAFVILAGGHASRMGGGDKPLRPLGGRPILDHVIERLAAPAGRLALNANGEAARFARYALPVLGDSVPDRPGPLAGILAGLDWASTLPGVDHLVSVPGDCPFLPADLAAGLRRAQAASGQPFACAASGGWTHPVIGLWPLALRETLRQALLAGERKIDRFTARFGCARAEWPIDPVDPFFNVNTPEELAEAARLLPLATGSPQANSSA